MVLHFLTTRAVADPTQPSPRKEKENCHELIESTWSMVRWQLALNSLVAEPADAPEHANRRETSYCIIGACPVTSNVADGLWFEVVDGVVAGG